MRLTPRASPSSLSAADAGAQNSTQWPPSRRPLEGTAPRRRPGPLVLAKDHGWFCRKVSWETTMRGTFILRAVTVAASISATGCAPNLYQHWDSELRQM